MTTRVRTALVSVGCFTVAFALVLVIGVVTGRGGPAGAPSNDEALSVVDAAKVVSGQRISVRGFVFFDPQTGPLLCSARTSGSRPACDGTVLRLANLDPNRLDLVRAEQTAGGYDAWSRGVVAVVATKEGDGLQVDDVLR